MLALGVSFHLGNGESINSRRNSSLGKLTRFPEIDKNPTLGGRIFIDFWKSGQLSKAGISLRIDEFKAGRGRTRLLAGSLQAHEGSTGPPTGFHGNRTGSHGTIRLGATGPRDHYGLSPRDCHGTTGPHGLAPRDHGTHGPRDSRDLWVLRDGPRDATGRHGTPRDHGTPRTHVPGR